MYVWWWIAAAGLIITLGLLVIVPLLYLPLKGLGELLAAFMNDPNPVLNGYWNGYPESYLKWCRSCFKLGFPTLVRWLREGWQQH